MSIFSLIVFLTFILLFVYIHYIPYNLVFILYLLYISFLVFVFVDFFDTPNILEAYFTALSLTKINESVFVCLYVIMSGVSIIDIIVSCWNILCHFLYRLFWCYYSHMILKNITCLFHLIHHKVIIIPFPINYLRVFFHTIIRYYSYQ